MSERNEKREQFSSQEKSNSKMFIPVIVAVFAMIAAGGWFLFGNQPVGGPAYVSAEQDGKVRFSAEDFSDGNARFYRFQGQSGPISFFVVKSSDGVVRSAFNTCDVCYKALKGYRQEGHEMVCNNCDQRFPTDKINIVKGGCNPAPLNRQQLGEKIVIAAADIEKGSWYFKGLQ